jgi:hypothetical protein
MMHPLVDADGGADGGIIQYRKPTDGEGEMRTKLVLKPGRRGTRKLLAEYGKRLVCVRYQYDIRKRWRRRTMELVLDEGRWEPRPDVLVLARIGIEEYELRRRIKAAGGRWMARKGAWRMRYAQALELGLGKRLID